MRVSPIDRRGSIGEFTLAPKGTDDTMEDVELDSAASTPNVADDDSAPTLKASEIPLSAKRRVCMDKNVTMLNIKTDNSGAPPFAAESSNATTTARNGNESGHV